MPLQLGIDEDGFYEVCAENRTQTRTPILNLFMVFYLSSNKITTFTREFLKNKA